jgi:hypothetical protein
MSVPRRALLLGLTALCASAGCSESKATVTGTVTFGGAKVVRGYITFYPIGANGEMKGARAETKGAEIVDGSYTVEKLSPGQRKVVIAASPRLVVQKTAKTSTSSVHAYPPAQPVPPNARGNSKVVTIAPGKQSLDFALEKK